MLRWSQTEPRAVCCQYPEVEIHLQAEGRGRRPGKRRREDGVGGRRAAVLLLLPWKGYYLPLKRIKMDWWLEALDCLSEPDPVRGKPITRRRVESLDLHLQTRTLLKYGHWNYISNPRGIVNGRLEGVCFCPCADDPKQGRGKNRTRTS